MRGGRKARKSSDRLHLLKEPEPFLSLGLNQEQRGQVPAADQLQFDRAVPVSAEGAASAASVIRCVACQRIISDKYFHAKGQVVCPECVTRIEAGQQKPPTRSLARAALYGAGAAIAGCAIYAIVAIVTGWELALIAILVGVMVGKAVCYGSKGGGRPQQILAVCLTYFAITTSYIPVAIHAYMTGPHATAQSDATVTVNGDNDEAKPSQASSLGGAMGSLLLLALAAPFLELSTDFRGIITLVIIFVGLRTAWKLTARPDIAIMGPYQVSQS